MPCHTVAGMSRSVVVLVLTSLICAAVVGCSDDGGSDRLERIDGPAEVDPDFGGVDGG
jgi:hypothetical protein